MANFVKIVQNPFFFFFFFFEVGSGSLSIGHWLRVDRARAGDVLALLKRCRYPVVGFVSSKNTKTSIWTSLWILAILGEIGQNSGIASFFC